jgi:hypothetical protein
MLHLLKYPIEAIIVALFAYIIGRKELTIIESIMIGLVALIAHLTIDLVQCFMYPQEVNPPEPVKPVSPQPIMKPQKPQTNVPFQFAKEYPEEPKPSPPKSNPITSIPNIKSRWMNWSIPWAPINANTDEYMIYPSYYASLTVKPGYHDNITGSNNEHLDQLSPKIWPTVNPLDRSMYSYQGQVQVATMTGGGDAPENQVDDVRSLNEQTDNVRLPDVIYSGDLIELASGLNVIQRATNNSQLLLDKPLPQIRSNLSKLRFENVIKQGMSAPIRYGDNIHIKHNALIDNTNKARFIKYGERLQSHQDGPTYEIFKLFKKGNMDSTDYVKYGDEFLIACGDQVGDKIFLKLELDRSISAESIANDAIAFTTKLLKPFTPFNLCVCQGETLYP